MGKQRSLRLTTRSAFARSVWPKVTLPVSFGDSYSIRRRTNVRQALRRVPVPVVLKVLKLKAANDEELGHRRVFGVTKVGWPAVYLGLHVLSVSVFDYGHSS